MREIRQSGSEGGGGKTLPTPITPCGRAKTWMPGTRPGMTAWVSSTGNGCNCGAAVGGLGGATMATWGGGCK